MVIIPSLSTQRAINRNITNALNLLLKIQEIGPDDINTHRMYIKFGCYEENKEIKL